MPRRRRPLLHALLVATAACGPGTGGDTSGAASTGSDDTGGSASTAASADTPATTDISMPTTGADTSSASGSVGEASSGDTGDPPPAAAECEADSDCVLVNDCCQCSAEPVDAPVDPCEENCLQPSCEAMSLFGVRVACRSGVCEFAEVTCSEGPVACDQAMPSCPAGTRVSVQDACWGPCVHPRYCADEPCPAEGCGDGWTCVAHQAKGDECVVVALECGGEASCACMAPYLDEFCLGACADAGPDALLCEDGG